MCHVKYLKTLLSNGYWWNNKIRARIHRTKSVLSCHVKASYWHKAKLELWLISGLGYRFKHQWNKDDQRYIKILINMGKHTGNQLSTKNGKTNRYYREWHRSAQELEIKGKWGIEKHQSTNKVRQSKWECCKMQWHETWHRVVNYGNW